MIEKTLRPIFQRFLVDPFARLTLTWLTPNMVTFGGAILGLAILPAMYAAPAYVAFALLLLSGFCDALDGTLARMGHTVSEAGTVLDIVCDRLVEFAIIVALFLVDPEGRGILTLLMLGSVLICVTSFLVVGMFSENESKKSFYYSPGLIERPEAFVFFGAMILLPGLFFYLSIFFSSLVFVTAMVRLLEFIKR